MPFKRPDIIRTPLTNRAYGYPTRGARRRMKARMLAVVHITGNKRTASYDDPRKGTRAEVSYMNRPGSNGPTAHTYVSRDGALFMCVSAKDHAAWSNGDLIVPNTDKPYVREMVQLARFGHNPNELVWREYECTGHPHGYDINARQLEAVAFQIARDAITTGLAIKPNRTVGLHSDINTVHRRNCPFDSDREAKLAALCDRAREWRKHLRDKAEPEPDPEDPDPDTDPDLEARLAAALGRAEALEDERDSMAAALESIGTIVDPYFDWEEERP